MITSSKEQRYIGSYRLIQCIGDGGMGAVYMAEHQLLGRHAAVKVLHPEYSHEQEYVERFFKEAKAAAAISHPGIVKIYDFGYENDGSAYIAMELLQGEGLDRRIARLGGLPLDQTLRFASQIANILAAAHDHGIVHRDLKPANLFIVPDPLVAGGERIKILDFGIAKFAVSEDAGAAQTRADAILGSPAYMAPEQIRRSCDVDHRADVYAMGCILFEMLCGRPPFEDAGGGVLAVIARQLHDAPPVPSDVRPDVPHDLDSVIAYLLAKEPEHRHASARDLERALAAIAGNTVTSPAPSSPAMAGQGASPGATITDDASGPNLVVQTLAEEPAPFAYQAPDHGASGHGASGNAAPTMPGVHGHVMAGPRTSQPMAGNAGPRARSETSAVPSRTQRVVTIVAAAAFMIGGGAVGLMITNSDAPEKTRAAPTAEPAPASRPVPKPTFTFRALPAPRSQDGPGQEHHKLVSGSGKKSKRRSATPATEVTVVQPDEIKAVASLLDGVDVSYLRTLSRTIVRDLVDIVPVLEPQVTWAIRTEPPGAEVVDIAGRVLGVTPTEAQLDVTPGYTEILTLRLAGHDDKEIQLSGERDFDQLVELNPRYTISLVSTPPGAEIRDGKGKVVGVTPHDIELSKSGKPAPFSLVLEGYEPATAEIVADGDKQHEVTLQKLRATVTIQLDSEPQGATVVRDGQNLGVTPLEDRFFEQPGKMSYVFELDGYQRKRVRIRGDRDGQSKVKLHRKCTKLSYLHVRC